MTTTTATPPVSTAEAIEALDSLDDYARMNVGVDAVGPRDVLRRFIAQSASTVPGNSEQETFNQWFERLPEGRKAVLRDNKWMLANAAFDAGRGH